LRLSQRSIALFWAPLAATWVMMATEGPLIAAVIARMPDPTFNLAAHGVTFALAILIEAPVIMLMSAATALVRDRTSFLKLRNFAFALNFLSTAGLLVLLIPSVFNWVTGSLIGLPAEVSSLTYGALWFMLPWPGAIGYRRFLQGVLIRAGKTRLVAWGTVIRLIAMALASLCGFLWLDIPGSWIGAMALGIGVSVEAVAARFMAAPTVRGLLDRKGDLEATGREISYRDIASFYLPLALTSLIGLTVQPLLTFFMGRSVAPLESLAVFPVVHSLSFFFRSMGLAFQDVAIALMGERLENFRELRRFALTLGGATSLGIALVGFTPLSHVWFVRISGLTPELTAFALIPTRLLVPLPFLSVILSLQRAILVQGRRTKHITVASAVELAAVALVFVSLGWGLNLVGATAAFAAFLGGRLASNAYLLPSCASVIRTKSRDS
jgi:progressive ankylosis protein